MSNMDLNSNFTGILSRNTSEDYINVTEEDDTQSLAESYMMFKIGLCIWYVWI